MARISWLSPPSLPVYSFGFSLHKKYIIVKCTNIKGRCVKIHRHVESHELNTLGKDSDRLNTNERSGEPEVSCQGPLTKRTPFASVLGESGSPVTNCSQGL